jgi:diacylglycerol kinase (CTP)
MASILFLVLGDMTAAIMGVSFGGDALGKLKFGRDGKKSLEGSLAMFCVCFLVGTAVFASVRLREYPIFFGALAATLTELYEPFGLNDNLTIPVFSSVAMQLAFRRINQC